MPKGVYNRTSLIGKKYHELTVISFSHVEHGHRHWNCQCSCGNVTRVSTSHLNDGDHKSCGHLKREYAWRGTGEIPKTYWTSVIRNAKIRNLAFNISISEGWELFLKQNRKCAYSGLDLFFSAKPGVQTASLDRIDSSKNYTVSNVQWIHKDVNYMKMDLSEDRFLELCKLITKNNKSITTNSQ